MLLAVVACLLLVPVRARAVNQEKAPSGTFDLGSRRLPLASLDGVWHFQYGDGPKFSKPTLDDSSWLLIRSDLPWTETAHFCEAGFFLVPD